jgi:hypothetical protein
VTRMPRPHTGHGFKSSSVRAHLLCAPSPSSTLPSSAALLLHVLLTQHARHLPLRREGVYFCFSSLSSKGSLPSLLHHLGELQSMHLLDSVLGLSSPTGTNDERQNAPFSPGRNNRDQRGGFFAKTKKACLGRLCPPVPTRRRS